MRILVIYNPQAGAGRAEKLFPEIKAYCEQINLTAEFKLTEYPGHAVEIASRTNLMGYDAIVASGGDGTLYEVVNGYYLNKTEYKPPVGLIPNGTGNAFMRELDLFKEDWRKAIDIIASNHVRMIDTCRYVADNQQLHFINALGTGFISQVGKLAIPLKKLGNAAYTLATLIKLITLKARPIELIIDGEKSKRESVFVEVSNSRYTGTTFLIAPKAKIDDGKLDVVILNKISRIRLIRLFNTIYDGSHINYPEIEYIQAEKLALKESEAKEIIPDGELIGKTPISVECLKQDLAFLWPR